MTEKVPSQMLALLPEIRFFQKLKEVTMFDNVRNIAIRESVSIRQLFLRIERSKLECFTYVSGMPQERLPE